MNLRPSGCWRQFWPMRSNNPPVEKKGDLHVLSLSPDDGSNCSENNRHQAGRRSYSTRPVTVTSEVTVTLHRWGESAGTSSLLPGP
jgi:hypothetical protein